MSKLNLGKIMCIALKPSSNVKAIFNFYNNVLYTYYLLMRNTQYLRCKKL